MTEQSIIIVIVNAESEKFQMSAEMSQDFSMSLILYLFYTVKLLKIYCSTQYSEQDHRNSYSTILAANCRAVSHAIRATDGKTRKSLS